MSVKKKDNAVSEQEVRNAIKKVRRMSQMSKGSMFYHMESAALELAKAAEKLLDN